MTGGGVCEGPGERGQFSGWAGPLRRSGDTPPENGEDSDRQRCRQPSPVYGRCRARGRRRRGACARRSGAGPTRAAGRSPRPCLTSRCDKPLASCVVRVTRPGCRRSTTRGGGRAFSASSATRVMKAKAWLEASAELEAAGRSPRPSSRRVHCGLARSAWVRSAWSQVVVRAWRPLPLACRGWRMP